MTTEEKFKKLLNIACDNGYIQDKITIDIDKDLNNLVLNTNFFECLFKNFEIEPQNEYDIGEIYYVIYNSNKFSKQTSYKASLSKTDFFKQIWMLEAKRGTALKWLFKHFDL